MMKKTFLFGALGYGLVEILWRGRTHPSMLVTGGICLCAMKRICALGHGVIRNALKCAAFITATEFLVGVLVNGVFQMKVWDYSKEKGNILGQICPRFSAAWFLLSLPIALYFRGKSKRNSLSESAPLNIINSTNTAA